MKPHIRRHFLGKRLGWGWAVYADKYTLDPTRVMQSFHVACTIAKLLYNAERFINVQV